MGYRCSRLGYRLSVDGIFLDRSRFMIHAAVAEARVELLFAIVGESDRVRNLGARSIHVTVDGDDRLAGVFRVRSDHLPPSWAA